MTRIDHAARSRSRMERMLSSYETGEDVGAIVVALAALNDATLALVEQQRIANLIALSQAQDEWGTQAAAAHDVQGIAALAFLDDQRTAPVAALRFGSARWRSR